MSTQVQFPGYSRSDHKEKSYDLAVKIWMEHPAKTDIEAVIRHYFSLLRAGSIPEAEQLIEHYPVRHVLKSLWSGSVEASTDEDEASGSPVADGWEQDLSWLGELDLADFHWDPADSHPYVEITYREQKIAVALGFRVKSTDAGWVLAGPATYW